MRTVSLLRNGLRNGTVIIQDWPLPLLFGLLSAMYLANTNNQLYQWLVNTPLGFSIFGSTVTPLFLINDCFMVLFFALAAKEIRESVSEGGVLNPVGKALNPLIATAGGVIGPICVYFALTAWYYGSSGDYNLVRRGWGIPTATDIALAWGVARMVFGTNHPAVNFLLLLAIADDLIGIVIIAVFYPSPDHPVHTKYLLLLACAMVVTWIMNRIRIRQWYYYLAIPGTLAWCGLLLTGIHPALTMVFLVPFMPSTKHDKGLYVDIGQTSRDTLGQFEHSVKDIVKYGLFAFAFANAGVPFSEINPVTYIVASSLIIGKTTGVCAFSGMAAYLNCPLPNGMGIKELVVAGVIAGIGLTVALFVCNPAFQGTNFLAPAKMGAMGSATAVPVAIILGRLLRIKKSPQTVQLQPTTASAD